MEYFNAFQFVVFMIALPSIIAWLSTAEFKGALALEGIAVICLICQAIYTINVVGDRIARKR